MATLIPWLFLLPPLAIAVVGLTVWLYGRSLKGKSSRKAMLEKYGILENPPVVDPTKTRRKKSSRGRKSPERKKNLDAPDPESTAPELPASADDDDQAKSST